MGDGQRIAVRSKPRHLFLFVGASGTGKSTLTFALQAKGVVSECVSHTTRQRRPGEANGVHYHFVTKEEFAALLDGDEFVEHVDYGGNRYGLTKTSVDAALSLTGSASVVVNAEGAAAIYDALHSAQLKVVVLFLLPPPHDELARRLKARGGTSEEVARRLAMVQHESDYHLLPVGIPTHFIPPGTPTEMHVWTLNVIDAYTRLT